MTTDAEYEAKGEAMMTDLQRLQSAWRVLKKSVRDLSGVLIDVRMNPTDNTVSPEIFSVFREPLDALFEITHRDSNGQD